MRTIQFQNHSGTRRDFRVCRSGPDARGGSLRNWRPAPPRPAGAGKSPRSPHRLNVPRPFCRFATRFDCESRFDPSTLFRHSDGQNKSQGKTAKRKTDEKTHNSKNISFGKNWPSGCRDWLTKRSEPCRLSGSPFITCWTAANVCSVPTQPALLILESRCICTLWFVIPKPV